MSPQQLQFVILRHLLSAESERASHWDLMIQVAHSDPRYSQENQRLLATWELPQSLLEAKQQRVIRLPDHRLAYLEFEGELTGHRGAVSRCEQGTVEIEHFSATTLRAKLQGITLSGRLRIEQLQDEDNVWKLDFA